MGDEGCTRSDGAVQTLNSRWVDVRRGECAAVSAVLGGGGGRCVRCDCGRCSGAASSIFAEAKGERSWGHGGSSCRSIRCGHPQPGLLNEAQHPIR